MTPDTVFSVNIYPQPPVPTKNHFCRNLPCHGGHCLNPPHVAGIRSIKMATDGMGCFQAGEMNRHLVNQISIERRSFQSGCTPDDLKFFKYRFCRVLSECALLQVSGWTRSVRIMVIPKTPNPIVQSDVATPDTANCVKSTRSRVWAYRLLANQFGVRWAASKF